MSIPIEKFGKDHWSTFAYLETRIVDYGGNPDHRHMRCDVDRHPFFAHAGSRGDKPPTRIKSGEVPNHDDWDCVDDLVSAGLLLWEGTGVNPVFKLTSLGWKVVSELRQHKANGGNFHNFSPQKSLPEVPSADSHAYDRDAM